MQFRRNAMILTRIRPMVAQLRLFSTTQVIWPSFRTADQWMKSQNLEKIKSNLDSKGYISVEDIVPIDEGLDIYQDAVSRMHSGEINTSKWRHDLGNFKEETIKGVENTGQIMWPQDRLSGLGDGPFHQRCDLLAKFLQGDDIVFDFDMLIYKDPKTFVETPWHQDEAYWPKGMVDKRALTFWMALDDVSIDNGCMWFIPESHMDSELRKHRPVSPGNHILMTDDVGEDENKHAVPLNKGSCVCWTGQTLHYAGGNKTDILRRTYIVNYRPMAMVEYERKNNFDHGRGGLDDIIS